MGLGLRGRAGDACANRRKRPPVKRLISSCALVLVALLSGCKQPDAGSPTVTSSFIHPGVDIVIKSVHTYAPNDNAAGSNDEIYVIQFNFTNSSGSTFAPKIDHFVIEDLDRRRFFGMESGNAALIGISNYRDLLKPGDSHDYTAGFRVPTNTTGTLLYDATF